jgi:hypothetical protein
MAQISQMGLIYRRKQRKQRAESHRTEVNWLEFPLKSAPPHRQFHEHGLTTKSSKSTKKGGGNGLQEVTEETEGRSKQRAEIIVGVVVECDSFYVFEFFVVRSISVFGSSGFMPLLRSLVGHGVERNNCR